MARTSSRTATNGTHAPPAAGAEVLIVSEDELEPEAPLSAADRVALAIEASTGDEKAQVRAYKVTDEGENVWCGTMSCEEYERIGYEGLRTRWGHGKFKVCVYGTTAGKAGRPGFGIRAQEVVTIAEDLTATPAPTTAAAPGLSGLERVLEQMAQAQQNSQQQIIAALSQRSDLLSMIKEVAPLVPVLRELFGGGRREQSIGDKIKEIAQLRETFPGLFGDGRGEPADPFSTALPSVIELVKTATAQQQGAPAAQLVPPVSMPPAIAHAAGDAPPSPQQQENPAMPQVNDAAQFIAEMRKVLSVVVGQAELGLNPEMGATVVYESVPDEFLATLRENNWFEALSQFAPEVAPHREWLEQARTLVLQWVVEDSKGAPQSDQPGGDGAAAP